MNIEETFDYWCQFCKDRNHSGDGPFLLTLCSVILEVATRPSTEPVAIPSAQPATVAFRPTVRVNGEEVPIVVEEKELAQAEDEWASLLRAYKELSKPHSVTS